MNNKKLLERILAGSKNVRFNDFIGLVNAFGFELQRVNGSHHNLCATQCAGTFELTEPKR